VPGVQRLVRCAECGFIYENPRFPEEAILRGYAAARPDGHDTQFENRVKSFYRALAGMKTWLPPPGARALDVGCAGGAFLKAAERFGYQVSGVEPSAHLADSARARGLDVRQCTLATAELEPASFDVVCFWDVLEHVTDPVAVLKQAERVLKPQGVLLVNYPDIGTLMAKVAGKRFWWILSVHLVHFSRATVARALSTAGFIPFAWKPYWQTLELGYLISIARLYLPGPAAIVEKLTPGFLKRLSIPYYASQTTCLARKSP
jgi:SAM-dependent methyltransferase